MVNQIKAKRWARLSGDERDKVRNQLVNLYEKGYSIRSIVVETGRSYGTVHTLLTEGQVSFRSRGSAGR